MIFTISGNDSEVQPVDASFTSSSPRCGEVILRHRCVRRGFTLVELLLVVSIIALLIGLLLPALGSARRAGRAAVNLANVRSLGQALHYYMNDWEALVPVRLPPGERHLKSQRLEARWHWFVGDYVGYPFKAVTESEQQMIVSGAPLPRLDNSVFLDPNHTLADLGGASGTIDATRNGSYGYNYHYLGNSRVDNPRPHYDNFPVRLSLIKTWDRTICIAGSLGNQTVFRDTGRRGEHSYTLDPPRLDTRRNNAHRFAQSNGMSPVEARHKGRGAVAFLDGHAANMTLAELGYVVIDADRNEVAHNRGDNSLWNGLGTDPEPSR